LSGTQVSGDLSGDIANCPKMFELTFELSRFYKAKLDKLQVILETIFPLPANLLTGAKHPKEVQPRTTEKLK